MCSVSLYPIAIDIASRVREAVNIPSVVCLSSKYYLTRKKEEKEKKKSPPVSVERLSHLQYLKLLGNYLACALKKYISLLRFTVSIACVCQPPTLCLHYAQNCSCST